MCCNACTVLAAIYKSSTGSTQVKSGSITAMMDAVLASSSQAPHGSQHKDLMLEHVVLDSA